MTSRESVSIISAGSVDAGKSTLLGVLKKGELDSKTNPVRNFVAKHKHECYDEHNKNCVDRTSCESINNIKLYNKDITLIDLAGHEKHFKTTAYGMTNLHPDHALLMVNCNKGVLAMTKEHLSAIIKLNIPLKIICTKEDITTNKTYERTKLSIKNELKKYNLEAHFFNSTKHLEIKKDVFKKKDSILLKILTNSIIFKKFNKNDLLNFLSSNEIDIKDEKNIIFINRYLNCFGFLKEFDFDEDFLDNSIYFFNKTRNPDFYAIFDSKIKKDLIKNLVEETVNIKDKTILKRFEKYIEQLKYYLWIFDNQQNNEKIKNKIIQLINEYSKKLVIENKKYLNDICLEFIEYSKSDDIIDNFNFSKELLKEIKSILSKYFKLKELSSFDMIKEELIKSQETSKIITVFTISSRTGYFIESLKYFLSYIPKNKDNWNKDEESKFYIDNVYGFNSKKSKTQLNFKGFVVSGILRGKNINLGDKVYIGPYYSDFIECIVKSMHDDFRNNIKTICNTHRGTLGLQIIDKQFQILNSSHFKKGMMVIKNKDLTNNFKYKFKAKIRTNKNSKLNMKSGFSPFIHSNSIKQTATIEVINGKEIKPGEIGDCYVKFLKNPEYVFNGQVFLFREGQTKGFGKIVDINCENNELVKNFDDSKTINVNKIIEDLAEGNFTSKIHNRNYEPRLVE